mgnify:CR=1 FL=1
MDNRICEQLADALANLRDFQHAALDGTSHQENLDHYQSMATAALDAYEQAKDPDTCGRCGSTPARRDQTCPQCTTPEGVDRLIDTPKVRLLVGAEQAYACISGNGYTMDVALPAGRGAVHGLRQFATEQRDRAQRLVKQAPRAAGAAAGVGGGGPPQ